MKVICIDNSNPLDPHRLREQDWVYEGEIYTVVEELLKPNGWFYVLAERLYYPNPVKYQAKRFLPLSEIDEVCLTTAMKLETAN